MIKIVNQIISFFLELGMLIAYGYYGMTRGWNFLPRLLFTILILSIVIALWAIFAAPKSERRLKMPYLVLFRGSVLFASAILLYQTGNKNIAIAMIVLTIVTQTISFFTEK